MHLRFYDLVGMVLKPYKHTFYSMDDAIYSVTTKVYIIQLCKFSSATVKPAKRLYNTVEPLIRIQIKNTTEKPLY